MNRTFVVIGALFLAAGLLWPWLKKLNLFHLPGDIVIDRPGMKVFFPITTMILLGAVVSLVLWLFRR